MGTRLKGFWLGEENRQQQKQERNTGGLSTAQRTMRLSAAPVEMTILSLVGMSLVEATILSLAGMSLVGASLVSDFLLVSWRLGEDFG